MSAKNSQLGATSQPRASQNRLQPLLAQMQQRGESRRAFAQRLGVNDMTVKGLLDGEASAGEKTLRAIARVLGWRYWELVRYLDEGIEPQAANADLAVEIDEEQANQPPTIRAFVQKLSPLGLSCCLMELSARYDYLQTRLRISRVQLGIRETAQHQQSVQVDPELLRVL